MERLKRKDWASIWLVVFTAIALVLIGRVAILDIYAVQSLKMGVVFIGLALLSYVMMQDLLIHTTEFRIFGIVFIFALCFYFYMKADQYETSLQKPILSMASEPLSAEGLYPLLFTFEIKIFSLASNSCNFPTPLDIQPIGGGPHTYTSVSKMKQMEYVASDSSKGPYCYGSTSLTLVNAPDNVQETLQGVQLSISESLLPALGCFDDVSRTATFPYIELSMLLNLPDGKQRSFINKDITFTIPVLTESELLAIHNRPTPLNDNYRFFLDFVQQKSLTGDMDVGINIKQFTKYTSRETEYLATRRCPFVFANQIPTEMTFDFFQQTENLPPQLNADSGFESSSDFPDDPSSYLPYPFALNKNVITYEEHSSFPFELFFTCLTGGLFLFQIVIDEIFSRTHEDRCPIYKSRAQLIRQAKFESMDYLPDDTTEEENSTLLGVNSRHQKYG